MSRARQVERILECAPERFDHVEVRIDNAAAEPSTASKRFRGGMSCGRRTKRGRG